MSKVTEVEAVVEADEVQAEAVLTDLLEIPKTETAPVVVAEAIAVPVNEQVLRAVKVGILRIQKAFSKVAPS